MKLEQKLFIDKVIGNPTALLLNLLARIIGFCLRIDHSLDKPFKTIAVSKYLGMGSIIQATPLLQTLREKYPRAKIIFVTNQSNKTLLEHISAVDEIYTIKDKNTFSLFQSVLQLLFKFWKRRPDVFIDLELYSNFSPLITTFSLSTNRMGFFRSDKKYRMGLFTHMMYFNQKSVLSEAYLQFARILGCKKIISTLDKIELTQEEQTTSQKILQEQHIEAGKYIVINPNTSDLRPERRWPARNFILLIEKILEQFPAYKVILIGAKDEVEFVLSISSVFPSEKVIDTSGKLTLVNLIYLIKNAALLVTNDTGPMHIGFAQGTKTIGLFGACSPEKYGNPPNSYFIYKNVYCSPCVHEFLIPPCKGNNQCMKLISAEEVWDAVKSFQTSLPLKKDTEDIVYESEYVLGEVHRHKPK